ncbi:MAG: DnaB helicase C-terminal domain-containing protein [Proteobacteria bacterium]|nr:DnaB helicase C-terminal domain-containing protein [Pseudomonadota bacterium]
MTDAISALYRRHLPEAHQHSGSLQAPCPFCLRQGKPQAGILTVHLNPDSFFHGYFHCRQHCVPGGFPLHFARTSGIGLAEAPGYDPDRDYFGRDIDYPAANLNHELAGFTEKLAEESLDFFRQAAIAPETLLELRVGYNGRYLVYPYIQANGNCYAARCVHPERPEDFFWHGDERFAGERFRLFNAPEIDHCENGALFLVTGEHNLLPLKQLGLPGIAVPAASDLEHLDPQRLSWIRTIFLWVDHSAESEALARSFATRTGYKVRIIRWPEQAARNSSIWQLAVAGGPQFQRQVFTLIKQARAFSPFATPAGEFQTFRERLLQESGASYANLTGGFARMDQALGGIHGINIMGGTPKAGKSAFFIQIASDMALRKIPVLYYDFENGRQKIYLRILSRLSRLAIDQIKDPALPADDRQRLAQTEQMLRALLNWLRVINDRRLSPETMRRHIDFLRHETNSDYTVVVIDSLHKLPFKDISQKRSGIDGWLRQLEAIRDELGAAFLVISELERNPEGQFDQQPHLGSFKGSGDIGYSADNAMVFLSQWDPFADTSPHHRCNELWLVASREQSPGRIASYRLDYPYWGFTEEA